MQTTGGVQGGFSQPSVLVHAIFLFQFACKSSSIHTQKKKRKEKHQFIFILCMCSLLECSDICNLIKDGEDGQ